MSERKLATIAKVEDIRVHPNADALELATIRGWQVVVKKGEFTNGDLCVYCEIDSLMPERPEYEFLAPRKYRIKTTKLRGEISQGIAFPLSVLESIGKLDCKDKGWLLSIQGDNSMRTVPIVIGADVTEVLGVTKYEEPIPASLGGKVEGRFPSHSIKTDEERIQNLKELFPIYRDHYSWIATEKLDGSSMTVFIHDDVFGLASRNLQLKEDMKNTFWAVARNKDLEYKMRLFMAKTGLKSLTLQGELIGEGVQKNKYKLRGQDVRFFRAFDPIKYEFLPYHDFLYAMDDMRLVSVPILDDDFRLPDTFEDLILFADGRSRLYETAREGVVFVAKEAIHPDARPLEKYQGRLSFKVISNKFILKHDA